MYRQTLVVVVVRSKWKRWYAQIEREALALVILGMYRSYRNLIATEIIRDYSIQISLLLLRYRITPNTTTGETPAELLMKRTISTRLSLIQPMEGQNVRERQEDQIASTAGNREMMPCKSVAIWNPRQDSRGRWLQGTIETRTKQLYLVNVEGHTRYVHLDHIPNFNESENQQIAHF